MSDVKRGDEGRIRFPTDYATANRAYHNHDGKNNAGGYWLRSPAYDFYQKAATIYMYGGISQDENIGSYTKGVVPALCLDLQ